MNFGIAGQSCVKLIQDISIYLQKCVSYCGSCPDGGTILQFGSSICLTSCPSGFYVNAEGTQCLKCTLPCVDCAGTATNCTMCGVVNNKKYYLNDTNLADPATGGVCVLNCTGAFYEGENDFECLPCDDGCA